MGQIYNAKFQALDGNGDPLSGGKVYTYSGGTATPKATYSDPDLGTLNANPVILDSRGEADVYGSGLYKLVLKTSADVTIWTVDNYQPISIRELSDIDGDTKIQVEESADEDIIRFDIAGTEEMTLQDGKLEPTTDNDVNLGSASKSFAIGYIYKVSAERVILEEQAAAPTVAADEGGLYTKALDGKTKLYFREESNGTEILLTDGGKPSLPRAYLAGLGLSNDTDTEHDILIAVGECRDSSHAVNLVLGTAITKRIDATWAVGDDAGGLFTGSVANDTWYHVFLIRKDSDGSIDAGFDTSVTAANIPTGYTEYRRIGAVLSDGSANILNFYQHGDYFGWDDPTLDVETTNPGTSAVLAALAVPLGVAVEANINFYVLTTDVDDLSALYISCPDANDEAASVSAAPLSQAYIVNATGFGAKQSRAGNIKVFTNTAKQVRYRVTFSDAAFVVRMSTLGYVDRRGRDD